MAIEDQIETAPRAESSLRDQIDDLAMQVVLDDSSAPSTGQMERVVAQLAGLGELARQQGSQHTAQNVLTLVDSLKTTEDLTILQDRLRKGITDLQVAVESDLKAASASKAAAPPPPAETANPLAQDPELLTDFIVESREHLTNIESQALILEKEPANAESINSVFRSFHTIKGLAGFMELTSIQQVAHEVETVLDLARNGKCSVTPKLIDVVLESADYLNQSIKAVEARLNGTPVPKVPDHQTLLQRITRFAEAGAPEPAMPEAQVPDAVQKPTVAEVAPAEGRPAEEPARPAKAPATEPAAAVEPSPSAKGAPSKAGRSANRQEVSSATISVRVDAAKLDYLMDMVGEMVITQSLLRHDPALASLQNPRLMRNLSQLSRATGEVQRTAMAMRMVPISGLFQRMARLVRDLSRKNGKSVEMETSGEETELDKNIAEELSDPLMHMVRNSLDHGIEDPAERKGSGKNLTARVRLAAYHQSGQIVIEISDDGRGLNREKILKKAREKGLIDETAQLSDADVHNLIFEPGFSTADQITDVSGRGVGMDVVKKQIQKLRGHIDIHSKPGQGTRFLLKLPLTLAIIDGLVVGVGGHRYIVPLFAVREMFRPAEKQVFTVENRDETVMVRGRLLPIVRLHRRFDVKPRSEKPWEALLIVSENEGKQFCLMVDDLIGKQEVVIKGLGETFKNVAGVAGGAILGDGRVGLILDMPGVFRGQARA